eukprot:4825958-Pyramimonas_sp.AAC.1
MVPCSGGVPSAPATRQQMSVLATARGAHTQVIHTAPQRSRVSRGKKYVGRWRLHDGEARRRAHFDWEGSATSCFDRIIVKLHERDKVPILIRQLNTEVSLNEPAVLHPKHSLTSACGYRKLANASHL